MRPEYHVMITCVSVVSYLVEQRAVSDGNTQGSEAPAKHHVIWSVIAVAAAAAGHEPRHRRPAEDHSACGRQNRTETETPWGQTSDEQHVYKLL